MHRTYTEPTLGTRAFYIRGFIRNTECATIAENVPGHLLGNTGQFFEKNHNIESFRGHLGGGGRCWLSTQYGVFVKEYPRTSTSGRCRYVNCKGRPRTREQEFASFATEHEQPTISF